MTKKKCLCLAHISISRIETCLSMNPTVESCDNQTIITNNDLNCNDCHFEVKLAKVQAKNLMVELAKEGADGYISIHSALTLCHTTKTQKNLESVNIQAKNTSYFILSADDDLDEGQTLK